MVEFIKIARRKNSEQENQNRTEIAESRSFVFLVIMRKLVLRQSNIACIGVLSLLIVKTDSLACIECSGSYVSE